MAAVVNHLHFAEPFDAAIFTSAASELEAKMRAIDGFRGFEVIQTSEQDAILVILADRVEVLDRIATEVGSPWMREHIVPLLDGPPQRHVGETIAHAGP